MKKNVKKLIFFCAALFVAIIIGIASGKSTSANQSMVAIQVSPMYQKITLNPGERYYGTFKITNPGSSQFDVDYDISVGPFFVDNNNEPTYENNGDYNQIVDWITVDSEGGNIVPNNTDIIQFYIDVPEDAPAGGQYAAIYAGTNNSNKETGEGISLRAKYKVAHLIYAEVAGETVRKGTISDLSVPGFLFKGPISASSSIKNEGNVHSTAISELRVFPLFSDEEVYTNEEASIEEKGSLIMPGNTRATKITWSETPTIGIFRVLYKVSFEGVEETIDRHVIICPIWLLVIILAIIFLILFKILFTGKKEKK